MLILPVTTAVLHAKDDLAGIIQAQMHLQTGDILIVSSKALATVEGSAVSLTELAVSREAEEASAATGRSSAFCEAVLRETARLSGRIVGRCPGALLTELQPADMEGSILAANAGMDESNIESGFAVGWPNDPVASATRLRAALTSTAHIAVIVTDSCCIPRRKGVTAYALACVGIDPLKSEIGSHELFGKTLRVTVEALADQLAVAGNLVMGNAAQATPVTVIRDHGIPLTDFAGWVPGIRPKEDLFRELFRV